MVVEALDGFEVERRVRVYNLDLGSGECLMSERNVWTCF